jgi:hypothetical protein
MRVAIFKDADLYRLVDTINIFINDHSIVVKHIRQNVEASNVIISIWYEEVVNDAMP